jgi:hypothetical protein
VTSVHDMAFYWDQMIIANICISHDGQTLMFLDRDSMIICVDMVYPYLLSTTFYGYMKTEIYVFPRGYTQVVNLIGSWFNPSFSS